MENYFFGPFSKRLFKLITILILSPFMANDTLANPQGGVVVIPGSATITDAAGTTTINQSAARAIINWDTFNIQNGEKTIFIQPLHGVALNRVNANLGASQINGVLSANGTIYIVNSAGIIFGAGAQVNVGGLIASTSNMTDANFLAGVTNFDETSTFPSPTIINYGNIKAAHYGLVGLLSSNVINHGVIKAHLGNILLGSGSKFTLDFSGDELINFAVAPTPQGSIVNWGKLQSNGGHIRAIAQIDVTPTTARNVLDNVIQMHGILIADTVGTNTKGEIILSSNGDINIGGSVYAAGWLPDQVGSTIKISGRNIKLDKTGLLFVDGTAGGGQITLTGLADELGARNAAYIEITHGAKISLNGTNGGGGGSLFIYGDNVLMNGEVFANAMVNGANATGGTVVLEGLDITLSHCGKINADGFVTGGFINIGGNSNSRTDNKNSQHVVIDSSSEVKAIGQDVGAGGGHVFLNANDLLINGMIDVSGIHYAGYGGAINLGGENITLGSTGALLANGHISGGQIIIGGDPFASPVSLTTNLNLLKGSTLEAKSVFDPAEIYSNGGGSISIYATNVLIDTKLDVSSDSRNLIGNGGEVLLFGTNIKLTENSAIDATGAMAGGYIQIGADQANNGRYPNPPYNTPHAQNIDIAVGSVLNASALVNGDGGIVKIWADNTVNFYGKILARGGNTGGNGGAIWLDGITHLNNYGELDVSAPNGTPGQIIVGVNH